MKRKPLLLGLSLLALTGCYSPNTTNGAVGGGLIGGILGTGVGIAAHNPGAGALIGAGTGALVGSAVGAEKDRKEAKQAQAAAQAYAQAHPPLSITEVIQLSNQRVSDDVIIQQMASSGSCYNLTAADIEHLTNNGVSNRVILAMQQRRYPPAGPVVVGPRPVYVVDPYPPPPPPVSFGVGVVHRW
jgi:hypothetical protein